LVWFAGFVLLIFFSTPASLREFLAASLGYDLLALALMRLLGCDVVDARMVVLGVVPRKVPFEIGDRLVVVEEAAGILRSSFYGAEGCFDVGIVIGGSGASKQLRHGVVFTEPLDGLGFHLAATVADELGPLVLRQVQDALGHQASFGRALLFYGITFRYAPTPQAKGKIERSHFFWQERLPPYFASENISDLDQANPHIQALRLHRNQHEIHRELKMKPQQAWDLALKEKRSVLHPVPNCPWWPFVWSLRSNLKVGTDGRVPIGSQLLRVDVPPGSKAILCHHPSGHHSVLASPPNQKQKPVILFSNLPK
jgi:hypothetical protein